MKTDITPKIFRWIGRVLEPLNKIVFPIGDFFCWLFNGIIYLLKGDRK